MPKFYKRTLKEVVISDKLSIKEAMRNIDRAGIRTSYLVDEKSRLLGVVTDSEIRRAILRGKDINDNVRDIVKQDPIVLHINEMSDAYLVKKTVKRLLKRMPDCRYILVLDNKGRPLSLIPCLDLLEHGQLDKFKHHNHGKSILVVGGAGYLGSVLVRRLLSRGYKVKVLDILMFGIEPVEQLLRHKRFQFIKGDMRNISTLVQALSDVDAVINLAAVVGDPACMNKPEMAIETNYLSNKALAEACKYHQINRFIYASTCSVYGATNGDESLDENSPLNPVSLYARSKIHSEEGILDLEDDNFSPTVLRMGTLYGYSPRMRFDLVVNAMTKDAVIEKKINVHGQGKQWRPLLHVQDAADIFIRCLESPIQKIKGAIFNAGSNRQNYQIMQVAKTVQRRIPNTKLIIEESFVDQRNYFVQFSLIEKELKFRPANKLDNAICDIKKAIEKNQIKDVNNSKYYNVEYK